MSNGFTVPTLAELVERIEDDLNAWLPGEDARLRGSEPYALARVLAGLGRGLYGFLEFLAQQLFADTAITSYLERWASVFGITRLQADRATGDIDATGNNGTVIPDGAQWESLDGSIVWIQSGDVTIAGGVAVVSVEAEEPGTASEVDAGTIAVLSEPIAGVDSEGSVATGGITGGDDRETDESLRERLLERIQDPPQGGAVADYVAWVRESGDVDRVFVTPNETGLGTVGIRFTKNVPDGGIADDAIPDLGDISQAQASVDAEKPVTADATVVAIAAQAISFDITVVPNTTAVHDAVEAELEALLIRTGEPGGTLYLSQISEAISSADGEEHHTLNTPAADVVIGADSFPTINQPIVWS